MKLAGQRQVQAKQVVANGCLSILYFDIEA